MSGSCSRVLKGGEEVFAWKKQGLDACGLVRLMMVRMRI